MGVQVIPIPTEVVSHSLTFPFPFLFYSHSHGIPGPIGNPIPMHISSLYAGPSGAAKLCTNIRRLYVKHDQSSTNKMYQKLIILSRSSALLRRDLATDVLSKQGPSVCLSVCLSQADIEWEKMLIRSRGFHHRIFYRVAQGLLVF